MQQKKYLKYIFLTILALIFSDGMKTHAQIDSIDYSSIPFVKKELNIISNDTVLYPFFDKLSQLDQSKKGIVKILHIGDSHIQADFFSGKIREYFQVKYGNAGRGLIFPYRAAGSNEPSDIYSNIKGEWTGKRNVHINNPLPIGVSAFTLHTKQNFADLHLKIKSRVFDYSFNKITIFHQKGDSCYDFALFDKNFHKIGFVNASEREQNKYTSTVKLDRLINEVHLQAVKTQASQHFTNIYGFVLENSYPGVLYNTIAGNGAAVYHYNQAQKFAEQVHALQPDLIIISLGSNEALNPPFFRIFFKKQLHFFTEKLKRGNPNVCIMFTTPPDSYLKKKFRNKNVINVTEEIIHFCNENNYAYWDLFNLSGGYASMDSWTRHNLSQKDKIHYTAKGYYIQANLFLESLEKSLKRFENIYR